MTRLEVRREQQDRSGVRVIGRRPVVAAPEKMPEARRRRTDVRVAVVSVDAPRLEDPVRVSVFSRAADVIHDLVPTIFDDGFPDAAGNVLERLLPRDLTPLAGPAISVALERVQDAVGILQLVRCDDALCAGPAAAAGMDRIAFDLPDREALLVDVREDAARRFTVEADARYDPVVAA